MEAKFRDGPLFNFAEVRKDSSSRNIQIVKTNPNRQLRVHEVNN